LLDFFADPNPLLEAQMTIRTLCTRATGRSRDHVVKQVVWPHNMAAVAASMLLNVSTTILDHACIVHISTQHGLDDLLPSVTAIRVAVPPGESVPSRKHHAYMLPIQPHQPHSPTTADTDA
jgi:hypothetical protein